jgi:hypothetical protein
MSDITFGKTANVSLMKTNLLSILIIHGCPNWWKTGISHSIQVSAVHPSITSASINLL